MKFLCGACERLTELRAFRVDAGTLVLTCPACGQETRSSPAPALAPEEPGPRPVLASTTAGSNVVELRGANREAVERARVLAAESPFAVPDSRCPKCIAPRAAGAATCPTCGADFSLISPDLLMPSAWLQQGWVALLRDWGRTEAHDALVVSALGKAELAALGRLYQLYLARVPDDPLARRGREEIVRRASVPALAASPPKSDAQPVWLVALVAVLAVGALVSVVALIRTLLEYRG